MIKKTITFTDFNGEEVTEDLYFNLSTPEITKLSYKYGGDLKAYIEKVVATNDPMLMIEFMEDLMLSSYGIKSEDGRRFVKGRQVREDFEYSQAYAELFIILITKPSEAKLFGEGLVTTASEQKIKKAQNINDFEE